MCVSARFSGLIIRLPTNPFPKRSRSQSLPHLAQAEFPPQRKRSSSFEICFVGAKTFSPSGGKGRVGNLVIHQLVSWTGVPSMHRDQKSERRLPAKPGCFSR